MYQIAYLSTEVRRQVKKLEDKFKYSLEDGEKEAIDAKITELRTQTKNYTECSIEESKDLQLQLYEKLEALKRIGKIEGAEQFLILIREVEDHVQRLMVERAKREESRKPLPTKEDEDIRQRRLERLEPTAPVSPDQSRAKSGRSRWTVTPGRGL